MGISYIIGQDQQPFFQGVDLPEHTTRLKCQGRDFSKQQVQQQQQQQQQRRPHGGPDHVLGVRGVFRPAFDGVNACSEHSSMY